MWDVSHQTYVHKILTGRRERFGTIRKGGGISGFAMRSESPYDPFGAGHASTAVAAALGMALARDFAGNDETVVAVIGDGALTGGLAYEALNNAGALQNAVHRHSQRQRDVDRAQRRLDRFVPLGVAHQTVRELRPPHR